MKRTTAGIITALIVMLLTVPGMEINKPKHTFIYRVPDTDYFVGAGFYVMSPGVFY